MNENKTVKKFFLCCATCLLLVLSANGQLNLKIGYNLNYSPFSAHNTIYEDFNADRPWLAKGFTDIHFSSALQLGFRFRGKFVGADATWERSSNRRTAQGIMPDESNFAQELNYATNRISLGLEGYGRLFGLGTSVYLEQFNIDSPVANIESETKILSSNRFGSKIYLILSSSGSDRLSISLQPYVAIPWKHYNLSPLSRYLGIQSDRGFIQENLHFGFSLVFYNGAQRG